MNDWSARQYLKFEDERSRPAADLLAQVRLDHPGRIVDIGCGPGNSTELLMRRWPAAEMVGIDASSAMLEAARRRLPGVSFVQADVAAWRPEGGEDLLFANAVFQWVPAHLDVLARLLSELKPGGVLAVQMPDNLEEPSHVAMGEAAAAGPWAAKLAKAAAARDVLPAVDAYYDRLKPMASHVDVWHVVYNHPLEGVEAVVEWLKGTGLRPFLDPLDPEEREGFLDRYATLLARHYRPRVDGRVLLRFPRLFVVAVRA